MQAYKAYNVVSPLGELVTQNISPAPPLVDLEGKRIGFIWTIYTNGDVLAEALMDLLGKRFKDIKTVKLTAGKGVSWGDYPDESIEEVVKEASVDAVIVTVGC